MIRQAAAYRDPRNLLARVVSARGPAQTQAVEEAQMWLVSHCRDRGTPIELQRQQQGLELCQACFEAAAQELTA
jgi:hypothetical protein